MNKYEKIKHSAYINELHKIAIQRGHYGKDALEFIKNASFADELKKISVFGNGRTVINKFLKTAEMYTPSKWEGVSGFHKAVSEDPKKYEGEELKQSLVGLAAPLPVLATEVLDAKRSTEQLMNDFWYKMKTSGQKDAAIKKMISGIKKKYILPTAVAAISGYLLAPTMLGSKYLKERGIKKGLVGNYSFNEEAKHKYL